jgi:LPXTG-motif cell wall-anchored protein
VAFERLLVEETEVAVHADLEDEDQTIHLTPPPEKPKTGDETRPALFASAALIGLLGAGALGILSRKKKH